MLNNMKHLVFLLFLPILITTSQENIIEKFVDALKSQNPEELKTVLHENFTSFQCNDNRFEFGYYTTRGDLIERVQQLDKIYIRSYKILEHNNETNMIYIQVDGVTFQYELMPGAQKILQEKNLNCSKYMGSLVTILLDEWSTFHSIAQALITNYTNAMSSRNKEQLFEVLSDDFSLSRCDQTRRNESYNRSLIMDHIQKIHPDVELSTHSDVQLGEVGYNRYNGILKFKAVFKIDDEMKFQNFFNARVINGKFRIINEQDVLCWKGTITTSLINFDKISRDTTRLVLRKYQEAIRHQNVSAILAPEFVRIHFCNPQNHWRSVSREVYISQVAKIHPKLVGLLRLKTETYFNADWSGDSEYKADNTDFSINGKHFFSKNKYEIKRTSDGKFLITKETAQYCQGDSPFDMDYNAERIFLILGEWPSLPGEVSNTTRRVLDEFIAANYSILHDKFQITYQCHGSTLNRRPFMERMFLIDNVPLTPNDYTIENEVQQGNELMFRVRTSKDICTDFKVVDSKILKVADKCSILPSTIFNASVVLGELAKSILAKLNVSRNFKTFKISTCDKTPFDRKLLMLNEFKVTNIYTKKSISNGIEFDAKVYYNSESRFVATYDPLSKGFRIISQVDFNCTGFKFDAETSANPAPIATKIINNLRERYVKSIMEQDLAGLRAVIATNYTIHWCNKYHTFKDYRLEKEFDGDLCFPLGDRRTIGLPLIGRFKKLEEGSIWFDTFGYGLRTEFRAVYEEQRGIWVLSEEKRNRCVENIQGSCRKMH